MKWTIRFNDGFEFSILDRIITSTFLKGILDENLGHELGSFMKARSSFVQATQNFLENNP